jgi:hypothetical protein
MDRILTKQELISYYSNRDLQNILWEFGRNREVGARAIDGSYFKRPSVLMYPADIMGQVMKGAASFHSSVERWTNALLIDEHNQSELRTGFDWIIDIDSALGIEEAKIAACLVRDFLNSYGVKYILKFSGRRGFHFGVFWENFPDAIDYKETRILYPELPKLLARFLRYNIEGKLWKELVEFKGSVEALNGPNHVSNTDPFKLIEVEKDWSNRHLFRMPYSIHEKTGKASVLIKPDELEMFIPEMAEIGNFEFREILLEGNPRGGERLISDAVFWHSRMKQEMEEKAPKKETWREFVSFKDKIMRDNFPPCIEQILTGIKDGRKRSIFTLIAFLRSCNWTWAEVDEAVLDWGKRMGMREGFVKAQLMWHKKQQKNVLPPNCKSEMFYKDMAICHPLPLCEKVKNPVNFAIIKAGKKPEKGKRQKSKIGGKENSEKTARRRRPKKENPINSKPPPLPQNSPPQSN